MRLSDFDYHLPDGLIAQHPATPRDSARLLQLQGPRITDWQISDLPDVLRAGDLLLVNNTKVIPARLTGQRGAGKVSVTLHQKKADDLWAAFAKPARKCPPGIEISFAPDFSCVVEAREGGELLLRFSCAGPQLDAALLAYGEMPLPPYIRRAEKQESDSQDYQTLFARHSGAVAAPTAGLHFTDRLTARLAEKGIAMAEVTLHVGAGTFLPVTVEDIAQHKMHSEWGALDAPAAEAIAATKAAGGRVVCVGTTSLRIAETAFARTGGLHPFSGDTDLFITPGFSFGVADMLLTNFHLPKSTLLMLVSAFAGVAEIRAAYSHAIETGYRFFSYGDACLLERNS
jgi:S-adenosylmethionine:tRNA ribosyltransferase-isomerase